MAQEAKEYLYSKNIPALLEVSNIESLEFKLLHLDSSNFLVSPLIIHV